MEGRLNAMMESQIEKLITVDQLMAGYHISNEDIIRAGRLFDNLTSFNALKRAVEKEKEIMWREAIQRGELDEYLPLLGEMRELSGKKKAKITEWILITINPDELHQNIKTLKTKVEKFVTRKFIEEYIYNFEQRGTESVQGIHTHILLKQNCRDGDTFRKSTINTFKSLVGNNMAINFKYITTKPEQAIPYITGVKQDDDKQDKMAMDVKWRNENNLNAFYYTKKLGIISKYMDGV